MFSRYKKLQNDTSGAAGEAIPSRSLDVPEPPPERHAADLASVRPAVEPAIAPKPVTTSQDGKDLKRRERIEELKTEMHHRLLDNLNLAAIEKADPAALRNEIVSITTEELADLGVVLGRDDRDTLNAELFDEVMGLGPLEPLLRDAFRRAGRPAPAERYQARRLSDFLLARVGEV